MRVIDAIRAAASRLEPSSDSARLDAELLMAEALGVTRDDLLLHGLDGPVPELFGALVARRLRHEPVAYILGRRAFWTIELEVGPGVLIPRPDSETLIEAAVARFGDQGPRRILDLGTGPGTLLLAALAQWPEASGIGVDRSEVALGFARRNARRLGHSDRAEFRLGDWGEGIAERFDLLLCNPPYVERKAALAPEVASWEPPEALFAGEDGLEAYRAIALQMPRLVADGGMAALEIGAGQAAPVSALFEEVGFRASAWRDLGGILRALVLDRRQG